MAATQWPWPEHAFWHVTAAFFAPAAGRRSHDGSTEAPALSSTVLVVAAPSSSREAAESSGGTRSEGWCCESDAEEEEEAACMAGWSAATGCAADLNAPATPATSEGASSLSASVSASSAVESMASSSTNEAAAEAGAEAGVRGATLRAAGPAAGPAVALLFGVASTNTLAIVGAGFAVEAFVRAAASDAAGRCFAAAASRNSASSSA